jgi:hypothetical protein
MGLICLAPVPVLVPDLGHVAFALLVIKRICFTPRPLLKRWSPPNREVLDPAEIVAIGTNPPYKKKPMFKTDSLNVICVQSAVCEIRTFEAGSSV